MDKKKIALIVVICSFLFVSVAFSEEIRLLWQPIHGAVKYKVYVSCMGLEGFYLEHGESESNYFIMTTDICIEEANTVAFKIVAVDKNGHLGDFSKPISYAIKEHKKLNLEAPKWIFATPVIKCPIN